jgi:hypothetical protein
MHGDLKLVLAYPLRGEMSGASAIAIGTQISFFACRGLGVELCPTHI